MLEATFLFLINYPSSMAPSPPPTMVGVEKMRINLRFGAMQEGWDSNLVLIEKMGQEPKLETLGLLASIKGWKPHLQKNSMQVLVKGINPRKLGSSTITLS